MLKYFEEIKEEAVVICPQKTIGDIINIDGLYICLPKVPKNKKDILFSDLPEKDQYWRRTPPPPELEKIKSMDEWYELPKEIRERYTPYIEKQFEYRKNGVWFMNCGEPMYLTPDHWMMLQWTKTDIGYSDFYYFQWKLQIHDAACEADPRCVGQIYTKCRRSGFTVIKSAKLVNRATQVRDKTLGIMSKTGDDAKENVFQKRVVYYYQSYPFFFKPIQDGTTNPKMELAFRTPSKKITKKVKVATSGEGLNTVINWKNTTINAYDGEKLYELFIDEAAKIFPENIQDIWRIHRTCLIVGRKVIGKANIGSTINPLDKGGRNYKKIWRLSDPKERNENGSTGSGLYKIFIPAYEALEGFFDRYGYCVVTDPPEPVEGIDGVPIKIGAKTFLENERIGKSKDIYELNEFIRQFPFSEEDAFRDHISSTAFNVEKIYQQIRYNESLTPQPTLRGNFVWANGVVDSEVLWSPDEHNGRWRISWLPPQEMRNKFRFKHGQKEPANEIIGVAGCDPYDIDATVDDRGSKGACMLFNKFGMSEHIPSNMFIGEYAERPRTADDFYEDVLMALVFYGYPMLIENNKYGIARYFQKRGYINYLMDRPMHLRTSTTSKASISKVKGVPTNSEDIISQIVTSIESYIHHHVGINDETEQMGNMYFERTLNDWIAFKPGDRTKYDLSMATGITLLAAQKVVKEKPQQREYKQLFREFKL
jgi:hypothetical protein